MYGGKRCKVNNISEGEEIPGIGRLFGRVGGKAEKTGVGDKERSESTGSRARKNSFCAPSVVGLLLSRIHIQCGNARVII